MNTNTNTPAAAPVSSFKPLHTFYPSGQAPVVRCPNYGLCGEYCDVGRASVRPGKVFVLCRFCARDLERRETAKARTEAANAAAKTDGAS